MHRLLLTPAHRKRSKKWMWTWRCRGLDAAYRDEGVRAGSVCTNAYPWRHKASPESGGTNLVGRGNSRGYSKGASRGGKGKAGDKWSYYLVRARRARSPREGLPLARWGSSGSNDETAFMRFAEDESVDPEEKLKSSWCFLFRRGCMCLFALKSVHLVRGGQFPDETDEKAEPGVASEIEIKSPERNAR